MQNRSGEMEVFVRVVEAGSLSSAAHALHRSPSAVSKLLARLESRLGVTLLRRSARALALTAEGERYFERARVIVRDIEQAELHVTSGMPSGALRVNCNIPFAQHYLLPRLPEFIAQYPGILLDLTQTDRPVDLIQAQADVAVRTGRLADLSLRSRKLFDSPRHVVAAPSYIARHGQPASPADLPGHNCLGFNLRRSLDIWRFRSRDGLDLEHLADGNFRSDNGETLRQMAIGGLGIARLSEFHIGADLKAGRLVTVLDDFNSGDREPVQALFVDHSHLSDRIRVFLDFLSEIAREN